MSADADDTSADDTSADDGPIDRALGWVLAVGILLANGLKWLVLWPYELLRTYLGVGEKRRDGEKRQAGETGEHPGGETGDEGRDDGAH